MKRSLAWSTAAVFGCAISVLGWSKLHHPEKLVPHAELPASSEKHEAHRSAKPHIPREPVQSTKPEAPPGAQVAKLEPQAPAPKEQTPEARASDRTAGLQKSQALLTESVAWLKERRALLGEWRSAEGAVLDRRIERLSRRLQTLEQGHDPDEGVVVPKN
jgi:hypothetical protein